MFNIDKGDVLAFEGGMKSIVEDIPWVGFGAELIGKEEEEYVLDALRTRKLCRITTKFSESYCYRFEELIRERSGAPFVAVVNSCASALHCAMVALNIGPGDEVLVSGAGWFSVATAVINVGAVPIPLECDESLTIDVDDIEPKITPRTKAIIVIHWRGLPADMDRIMEIAKCNNLKVVEDVAQAFGGTYKGKFLGSIGDIGCYSFNMHKVISAGEGGALAIKDASVYKRAFSFSGMYNYYQWRYNDGNPSTLPTLPMLNLRMPEICAAIACAQMSKLDNILSILKTRHAELRNKLALMEGLKFALSHDPEGECGYTLPLVFPTSEAADFFFNAMLAEGAVNIATLKYGGFGGGEARGTADLGKEFAEHVFGVLIPPIPNAYSIIVREKMGSTVTADVWDCMTQHIGTSDKLDPWKLLNGPAPKLPEGIVPKTKERLGRLAAFKLNVMMEPRHIELLAKATEKVVNVMRERKML